MLLFAASQAATPSVSLLKARCSVKDFKHFPRIQTEGLAYFSPPLAVIGRTARSQKLIARSRNCVYVVAAQKLPPTSGGYSAVSARTPAPQERTGLTYHR